LTKHNFFFTAEDAEDAEKKK